MVNSKIDKSVEYLETKKIDPRDLNMNASLYEMHLDGTDIIVAIGKSKDDFQDKGILYYPIYLVKSNKKASKIGVFEIINDHLSDYLDPETNTIDIEKMEEPLLFSFALLKKKRETAKEYIESSVIPEERRDTFVLSTVPISSIVLREETKRQATDIREKYKLDPSHTWIQEVMENPNYSIKDNEGGGECFFATIRDAFESIGQVTEVSKLRKKLAQDVTESTFMNYKEHYDMYNNSIKSEKSKIAELKKEYLRMKEKFKKTLNRDEKIAIIEETNKIKEHYERLTKEVALTKQMLEEYSFMKDADTLDKFREIICKCDFWAETVAVSSLERILNIKFIILSKEIYNEYKKTKDNKLIRQHIIQCGQLNDNILEAKGEFMPEYYIIVEYNGSHYKLVGYKNKYIFKFKEIPFDVKKLVLDKCIEKNAGPFFIIPDFKRLKLEMKGGDVNHDDELSEAKLRNLYEDEVVFQFHSKSLDSAFPGKGIGEKIPGNRLKEFSNLAIIPQWRKKLSNFWIQPFLLDNHKWSSVEHYYQASKFKKNNPKFYLSFSVESNTDLSKNPEMAKAAGSKRGTYKNTIIRPSEVTIDTDFYGGRDKKEIYAAQYAKFSQNEDLKNLLLATNRAKLTHFSSGKEPILSEELMMIRNDLARRPKINL